MKIHRIFPCSQTSPNSPPNEHERREPSNIIVTMQRVAGRPARHLHQSTVDRQQAGCWRYFDDYQPSHFIEVHRERISSTIIDRRSNRSIQTHQRIDPNPAHLHLAAFDFFSFLLLCDRSSTDFHLQKECFTAHVRSMYSGLQLL